MGAYAIHRLLIGGYLSGATCDKKKFSLCLTFVFDFFLLLFDLRALIMDFVLVENLHKLAVDIVNQVPSY